MTERPILFSAPMVRAILECRKTQTRRVIKPQPSGVDGYESGFVNEAWQAGFVDVKCPYGKPGDRLWVRETFTVTSTDGDSASVAYKARLPEGKTILDTDGGVDVIRLSTDELIWADKHIDNECWRPSIFMPRWASRLILEITEVRVQRLQDISEGDCEAEGIETVIQMGTYRTFKNYLPGSPDHLLARFSFRSLWDSINAVRGFGWDTNPWVWAVSFKAVTK